MHLYQMPQAVCACDFHKRPGSAARPYVQAERFQQAYAAAKSVDTGKIAAELSQKLLDSNELPAAVLKTG